MVASARLSTATIAHVHQCLDFSNSTNRASYPNFLVAINSPEGASACVAKYGPRYYGNCLRLSHMQSVQTIDSRLAANSNPLND